MLSQRLWSLWYALTSSRQRNLQFFYGPFHTGNKFYYAFPLDYAFACLDPIDHLKYEN